jgi:hypothetical protein
MTLFTGTARFRAMRAGPTRFAVSFDNALITVPGIATP